MVRLLGGARGSDVPCIEPDCVPDLEWRDRQASRCGVDLVLLEGTRYLVAKIQMELLEICRNLVSSIRHHRFKGHFEFRVKALVSEERSNHGRRVRRVIVRKFSQREEIDPIVLLVVDVHTKILLQDLIDLFSLTIRLRVVGS